MRPPVRAVAWLVALAVVMTAAMWGLQRRLIYLPSGSPVPPAARVLPGAEEVQIGTGDGLRLGAWFVPASAGVSRPAVLVLPGNAGNRVLRAPLARALGALGLHVLLVDYRGYGGNPGSPSEPGLLADARAALGYLRQRPDVDPHRVVVFGESLGAAVAVTLAVETPPSALVLRSPFTSLADVGRLHYPFLPVGLLLRDRFEAAEQVRQVRSPLLVLAGAQDTIVPAEQSRRLYEVAPDPKRYVEIPGVDHNDPELFDGQRLLAEVRGFLMEHHVLPS